MFIDYLSLMLLNMAAGLVILAGYLYRGMESKYQKKWVPGFAITGFIALTNGYHMTWTWPLPGSYNSAFGEMSILFGVLFLGAALALAIWLRTGLMAYWGHMESLSKWVPPIMQAPQQ